LRGEIGRKTADWGISVKSVEIRDVAIPVALQHAMSRQAQAEREKQARVQLRAMKIIYETTKERGATSDDMRVSQESADPRAVAALEYFIHAMTKYAGAYAAVLAGLDAFVFTAGIGEHSVPVRAALCAKLAWLGVKLDKQANTSGGPRISAADSAVSVWVIPINEELMIAQHTLALVRP
jgi:acetate kinase